MADDDEKKEEQPEAPKKGGNLVLVIVVAVLVIGAMAGGIFLSPMLMPQNAAAAPPPVPSVPPEPTVLNTVTINPIVVDIRGDDGAMHHLKVSLTAELPVDAVKTDVETFLPRGREAAISYLRGLEYEDATAPDKFETIRETLALTITEAVGEKRIEAIRVTDFVAQ